MAKVKLSAFDRLRLGARLNRKERRAVEQRLSAADPGLEIAACPKRENNRLIDRAFAH